jgi:hypothetical protein
LFGVHASEYSGGRLNPNGESDYFFAFGLGLTAFSSFEAAAAFCVARLVALLCSPGTGLQLPLVRGCLPGTGSKPGQQGLAGLEDLLAARCADFFAVVMYG